MNTPEPLSASTVWEITNCKVRGPHSNTQLDVTRAGCEQNCKNKFPFNSVPAHWFNPVLLQLNLLQVQVSVKVRVQVQVQVQDLLWTLCGPCVILVWSCGGFEEVRGHGPLGTSEPGTSGVRAPPRRPHPQEPQTTQGSHKVQVLDLDVNLHLDLTLGKPQSGLSKVDSQELCKV